MLIEDNACLTDAVHAALVRWRRRTARYGRGHSFVVASSMFCPIVGHELPCPEEIRGCYDAGSTSISVEDVAPTVLDTLGIRQPTL